MHGKGHSFRLRQPSRCIGRISDALTDAVDWTKMRVSLVGAMAVEEKMDRAGQKIWIVGRQTEARSALYDALQRCKLAVSLSEIGALSHDGDVPDLVVVFLTGDQCEAAGRMLRDPFLMHTRRVFIVDSSDRRSRLYCATARLDDMIVEPIGVREALVRILLVLTRSNHAHAVAQAVLSYAQTHEPAENRLLCNGYSSGVMPAIAPPQNDRSEVESHLLHAHEPLVTALTKIRRDAEYSDWLLQREEAEDWVRDEVMLPITVVEDPEGDEDPKSCRAGSSHAGDSNAMSVESGKSESPPKKRPNKSKEMRSETPSAEFRSNDGIRRESSKETHSETPSAKFRSNDGIRRDSSKEMRAETPNAEFRGRNQAKKGTKSKKPKLPIAYPTPEQWKAQTLARLDSERRIKERRQNAFLMSAIVICLVILAIILSVKLSG